MRVIFLTLTFAPEPGALRGLPLAKWLATRGYDVKILTAFPNYPRGRVYPGYRIRPWQWEVMDNIRVLRVPIYPSHDTSAIRRILTYLSFAFAAATIGAALIGPADVVYFYDPPPTNGIASLVLKLFRRMPIVHTIGDMWPETVVHSGMIRDERIGRWVNFLLGRWCRFLYRHAEVVTVLSPGFKRLLVERGVPEDKIKIIYNWAEDVYRPVTRDESLARKLSFEGRFNFVYAGNFGPFQAVDTIVKAAALVRERSEIQIVLIGTGPREKEVKELVARLALHNVRFLERRQYWEMPAIYGLADVLVVHMKDIPFLRDTIPSKTQVSLACGRPILMAVSGDAADLVERAGAGLICPSEDPAAMAAAMLKMAALPKSQLERMASSGREYYLTQLSLETAGDRMDAIFREVVERRSKNRGRAAAVYRARS